MSSVPDTNAPNLIVNGSFEDGNDNIPSGWTIPNYETYGPLASADNPPNETIDNCSLGNCFSKNNEFSKGTIPSEFPCILIIFAK